MTLPSGGIFMKLIMSNVVMLSYIYEILTTYFIEVQSLVYETSILFTFVNFDLIKILSIFLL